MNKKKSHQLLDEFKLTNFGFALFAPISILAVPVSLLVVNPELSAMHATLWGIALTIATYIPYLALFMLINQYREKRFLAGSLFSILAVLVVGVIRGAAFFQMVEWLDLNQPSPRAERIISSSLTTLFWLLLSNFVVSISGSFKKKYQATLNQVVRHEVNGLDTEKAQNFETLDSIQQGLSDSIQGHLSKVNITSAQNIANSIAQQLNNVIRPISQRIWIERIDRFPIINHRVLLADALRLLDFSTYLFLLILIGLGIFNNLFLRGATESFLRTISTCVLAVLIILFYRNQLRSRKSYLVNSTFLVLLGLLPILGSELFLASLGYKPHWVASFLISPVLPAIALVLSVLRLNNLDRNLIIDTLIQYRHPNPRQVPQQDLAVYLHNTLQAELLALSTQLEKVAISGNQEELQRVLQRVSAVINRSLVDDFEKYSESPLSKLESLVQAWSGVLSIEMKIEDELLQDHQRNVALVQTIEEVISNAFRKGQASKVSIEAAQTNQGLELTVISDGVIAKSGARGLGTQWFDSISIRPWHISEIEAGTEFRILI